MNVKITFFFFSSLSELPWNIKEELAFSLPDVARMCSHRALS